MPFESVLNLLITIAALALIGMGVRYFWHAGRYRLHHPEEWTEANARKMIPQELIRYEQQTDDKVRLYNFWFQTNRVLQQNVPGDFAELGVYKGESAWLLHQMAPDRTLHLFDTFKGFNPVDLTHESGEAARYDWHDFADTDAAMVLQKLQHHPGVRIHEGYFPETTAGLETTQYALVHIDADLYAPVSAGLSYFYPRLSPGGVIMVHDYTHLWEGLTRAVDEFAATIPEVPVPVPDKHGTIMIIKNR